MSTSSRTQYPEVNVREIRREYDRRTKLPQSLVVALAKATTLAEQAWQEAREKSAFEVFRPHLEEVVGLTREVAAALRTEGSAYDALLDRFEPGETSQNLKKVFGALRDELAPLVAAIVEFWKGARRIDPYPRLSNAGTGVFRRRSGDGHGFRLRARAAG